MISRVHLEIHPQPDLVSCGPACLASLYTFWGDDIQLEQVLRDAERLPHGGTIAVLLACHALERGYRALLYTYNITLFDPTWFEGAGVAELPSGPAGPHPGWTQAPDPATLAAKLRAQLARKPSPRLAARTEIYLRYLELGGLITFADLEPPLLVSWLERGIPLLTGLSATYLYREARERVDPADPNVMIHDDVGGEPSGHFVLLRGYDRARTEVLVADPLQPSPVAESGLYRVGIERLQTAILLGILTDDANLLVLEPSNPPARL